MKTVLIHIAVAILMMILWTGAVFLATVNGWLHQPITKLNNVVSFPDAVDKELDKQFVGSFAMAIMKGGIVEFEKFHSAGKPTDRNTVFQVSSLSKWISALGIMKLVEEGKLNLDTPVSRYLTRWQLPAGKFNNDEVTVRRLLSHTAGLTDGLGYSGFEEGTPVQPVEQSLTKAADADEGSSGVVSVGIKPGTTFRYSGGGYTLLQLLVEEVKGQSFSDYMKKSVFEPLNMVHSTYLWDEHATGELVEFYNSDGTTAKHYRYTSLAATSLYTSLSDLELFFQAHLNGKEPVGRNVVKPETIKMMRQPHGRQMGADIWGLGTILYAPTEDSDFIIGHDGKSTPPINTAVRLNPLTGDGIIVLETGSPALATRLASEWVFWKTGQVDTLLFTMLVAGMTRLIGTGWAIIVAATVVFGLSRLRNRRKPQMPAIPGDQ